MKSKKNRMIVLNAGIILIVSAIVGSIYFKQLRNVTENTVKEQIEEIAAHDLDNIQSRVNDHWEHLLRIYNRVYHSKIGTIEEACEHLKLEEVSGFYDTVGLLDENGNIYFGNGRFMKASDGHFTKRLLNGERRIALNYEYKNKNRKEEVLAFGLREQEFEIENVTIIGIVGFADINDIGERLRLRSFRESGNTVVIDGEGHYIVHSERRGKNDTRENFFEELQEKSNVSEKHIKELQFKIKREHKFYDEVACPRHKEDVVYYSALKDTDWILVLRVPKSLIANTVNQFVSVTGLMLLALIFVFASTVFISLRFFLDSIRAKADSKARSEFLSIMSHEIRTPLNGIIGLNYLMKENLDNKEKMCEYLHKSDSTAKYLMTLINDILDMSKLQAGKMEICEKPFSVTYMISTIESIIRSRMDEKDIQFEIKTDFTEDALVGDETRIKQILMNILVNASKFTDEGGRVTFSIRQKKLGEKRVEMIYEIADNGIGMTAEFKAHIFDSFAQAKGSSHSGEGTGLGMAISSLLAKQMGGELSVESQPGEGSVFTFKRVSEISDVLPDTVIVQNSMEQDYAAVDKKIHILLAEDHDLNAEILMELLEEEGFEVDRAADGREVVEMFENSELYTYDLILMDVQMPYCNGYEATRLIRESDRADAGTVLIYACTANAFKEDRDMAFKNGMDDFVTKPINVDKLMKKLETRFGGGAK